MARVFVTGASIGLGLVTVTLLRERGDEVVGTTLSLESAGADALRATGAAAVRLDITDDVAVRAVVDRLAEESPLDAL